MPDPVAQTTCGRYGRPDDIAEGKDDHRHRNGEEEIDCREREEECGRSGDTGDGAGCTKRPIVRIAEMLHPCPGGAGDQRDEIDRQESCCPQSDFKRRPEEHQGQHVEEQVRRVAMDEG